MPFRSRPKVDRSVISVGVTCMVRRRTARRMGVTRTVCENVSGLLVENDLRALDDDAHVRVLVNRHGLNDLVTPQVFRHTV